MKPRYRLTASGLCQALGPDGWIDYTNAPPAASPEGQNAGQTVKGGNGSDASDRAGPAHRSFPVQSEQCVTDAGTGEGVAAPRDPVPAPDDLTIPTFLRRGHPDCPYGRAASPEVAALILSSVSGASARPPLRRVAMPEAPSLGASSLTAGASAPAFPFPLRRHAGPGSPTQAARVDLPSERRRPASGFTVRHGMHDTTTVAARGAAVLGKSTGGI
jgi:hypothetical protein